MNFLKHTSCFKSSNLLARSLEIHGQLAYTMLALGSRLAFETIEGILSLALQRNLKKIFWVLNGKATALPMRKAAGKLDIDANTLCSLNTCEILNSYKTRCNRFQWMMYKKEDADTRHTDRKFLFTDYLEDIFF